MSTARRGRPISGYLLQGLTAHRNPIAFWSVRSGIAEKTVLVVLDSDVAEECRVQPAI